MSKMLKSFITYGLSILLLSATLHVALDHHEHYDGYSMCDSDCDDEKHHSTSHQCEKCLNNNNRSIIQGSIDIPYNSDESVLYFSVKSFKYIFSHFNLYSRPPPSLL